jgi:hypothetical protein
MAMLGLVVVGERALSGVTQLGALFAFPYPFLVAKHLILRKWLECFMQSHVH